MSSDDARVRFPAAQTRLMFVAPDLRDRLRAQRPLASATPVPSAEPVIEPAPRRSELPPPLPPRKLTGADLLVQTRLWPVEKVLAGQVPAIRAPAAQPAIDARTDASWLRRLARRLQLPNARRVALYAALGAALFAAIQSPRASGAELQSPRTRGAEPRAGGTASGRTPGPPRAAATPVKAPGGSEPSDPAAQSGGRPVGALARPSGALDPAAARNASSHAPSPAAAPARTAEDGDAAATMARMSLEKLATATATARPEPRTPKPAGAPAKATNAPATKRAAPSVTPRSAAEALAAGDVERAARLFRQLAAQSPEVPAYAAAARILDARRTP